MSLLITTPRRTRTPGVRRAAAATAPSSTGRLAVTVSNRSSPGRNPPVNSSGRQVRTLKRNPPRASSSVSTSGSSASISLRHRGSMKWSMRNCPTPRRSHPFQASSGSSMGSLTSRSSTVTSWPSFASSIAYGDAVHACAEHQYGCHYYLQDTSRYRLLLLQSAIHRFIFPIRSSSGRWRSCPRTTRRMSRAWCYASAVVGGVDPTMSSPAGAGTALTGRGQLRHSGQRDRRLGGRVDSQ